MRATAIAAIVLALVGCGGRVEGSYVSDKPALKGVVLTLKPNGKAVYLGVSELDYEVDGKDVKLRSPTGTLILKGHDDGSLDFPGIGNLKKVPG